MQCLMLFLMVAVANSKLPEHCSSATNIACCLFGGMVCENYDCRLCIEEGGAPAEHNTTCEDALVCEIYPPPMCDYYTICSVAFLRCRAIRECAVCFDMLNENQFCEVVSPYIRTADAMYNTPYAVEDICDNPNALSFWLQYVASKACSKAGK